MGAQLAAPRRPTPAIEFRPVDGADGLSDFAAINNGAYGYDPSSSTALYEHYLRAPGSRPIVGWVDGEPVTSAAAFPTQYGTYLGGVATVEKHRGNGYGEAASRHAIEVAMTDGSPSPAILFASPKRAPFYEPLGFVAAATLRVYRRGILENRIRSRCSETDGGRAIVACWRDRPRRAILVPASLAGRSGWQFRANINKTSSAFTPLQSDAADPSALVTMPAFPRSLSHASRAAFGVADAIRLQRERGGIGTDHLFLGLFADVDGAARRAAALAAFDERTLVELFRTSGLDVPGIPVSAGRRGANAMACADVARARPAGVRCSTARPSGRRGARARAIDRVGAHRADASAAARSSADTGNPVTPLLSGVVAAHPRAAD